NGQQKHEGEHCRQATQPFGFPCLRLGSLTLCVGSLLLLLSQPASIVQFALPYLFLALELGLALSLAGIKKSYGQLKVCTITFRPGRGRPLLLPPGQSVFQVRRAPERSLASVPQTSGLLQTPVVVG